MRACLGIICSLRPAVLYREYVVASWWELIASVACGTTVVAVLVDDITWQMFVLCTQIIFLVLC